jgi:Transposase and inactivated derivatives
LLIPGFCSKLLEINDVGDTTRAQYAREWVTLPSDLTDAEWSVLEPLLPPAFLIGRPRKWTMRRIIGAVLYLLLVGLLGECCCPAFSQ